MVRTIARRISADGRILWFRGHRSAIWDVQPSVWRPEFKGKERDLTNRFRSRAGTRHQALPAYEDSATWLSLMQHYGLPTRLLDWTRSPLIAAYFALERYIYEKKATRQDAAIWILEPHKLNVSEGFEDITPTIEAHMCTDLLKPAFTDKRLKRPPGRVLAAMAAERDIRMFIQQGCFTIHMDETPLNKRRRHETYLTRLTIPAEFVKNMAFEIDVCGFRKGDIFPDLGHLADELRRLR